MTLLTRDFVNPSLSDALGAKGGGSSLNLSGELLATAQALDLDTSGWPPFMPFISTESVTAAAGQFAEVFVGLNQNAPATHRLVIDRITVRHNDAAAISVDMGLQSTNGTFRLVPILDTSLVPQGGTVGATLPFAGTGTASPVGKTITFGTNGTRLLAGNGVIQQYDLLCVLTAGFLLMLEAQNAAVQISATFRGRLYTT